MFEPLERRTLLSAQFYLTPQNVLFVIGSDQADGLSLSVDPMGGVTVSESGSEVYNSVVRGHSLQSVVVLGLGGDDTISVANNAEGSSDDVVVDVFGNGGDDQLEMTVVRARGGRLHGGFGNDTLKATNAAGRAGITLDGFYGDDVLTSSNTLAGPGGWVYGGPGDDQIFLVSQSTAVRGHHAFGGFGRDIIDGGDRMDIIYGGPGDDVLRGNAGNDYLFGGLGDDQLFGGDGNDALFGGSGADDVDGGSGSDRALVDEFDTLSSIETVI